MKIYSVKRKTIPKIAVLATGLTVAILAATIHPTPAQAFPNKQAECTTCHGSGTVAGMTTAMPSTSTPAAGAAYTVAITISANASAGDTGYWIANSTAAGVTGTTTGVYGGYNGTGALSYTAPMTAPTAVGTYYYKVWAVNGSTGSPATTTNFCLFSITVAPVVTVPPTTVPPVTSAAVITMLSPRHGVPGSTVTVTGSGFGALNGSVQFGDTLTTASAWTDTEITFVVPDGNYGRSALVSVIPADDTASNALKFRFDRVRTAQPAGHHHSFADDPSFRDRQSVGHHDAFRDEVGHSALFGLAKD